MPVPATAQTVDHRTTMTAPATTQSVDHQTRFQAAVDVIQNLPKDGAYRPSYEVMLRFYGLYKQAVFGPCQASRPGFWDPVGRYKWDAWSRLGAMSSEHAMGRYVDEMKKVAQEIIDTVPMNEKTASVFHHFEPLYVVIHDMPRPPPSLLRLRGDVKDSDGHQGRAEDDRGASEEPASGTLALEPAPEPTPALEPALEPTPSLEPAPEPTPALEPTPEPTPALESTAALEPAPETPALEPTPENPALEPTPATPVLEPALETPAPEQDTGQAQEAAVPSTTEPQGLSEGVVLTSDSESEVFLDSVDSVELLNDVKAEVPTSNGLHNGHAYPEHPPPAQTPREEEAVSQATQVGAGQGGEGAEDGKGPPMRRSRDGGREGTHQGWRERGVPPDSPRRAGRGAGRGAGPGGGAGGGGGGAGGPEGGPERPQDSQVQQQIVLALRRLREDMRSVMDRLEVVERLTAAHAQSPDWRPCRLCAASSSESESEDGGRRWWPSDVSGRTLLLLLLWPFVAQGLVVLLRRTRGRNGAPV